MKNGLHDRDLYALAAGALDPGDALAVQDALAADPAARVRYEQIRARLAPPPAGPPRWRLPVMPLAGRVPPVHLRALTEAHLGGGPLADGDRLVLRVRPPASAEDVRPVVIREGGVGGGVLYPLAEGDWEPLAAWPEGDEGYEVDLVVTGPPGEYRYVVVLADARTPIDWTLPEAERWAALRELVEDGLVPAADAKVRVV